MVWAGRPKGQKRILIVAALGGDWHQYLGDLVQKTAVEMESEWAWKFLETTILKCQSQYRQEPYVVRSDDVLSGWRNLIHHLGWHEVPFSVRIQGGALGGCAEFSFFDCSFLRFDLSRPKDMPVTGKRQLAPKKQVKNISLLDKTLLTVLQAPSKKRRITPSRQDGSTLSKKSHLGHNKVKGKEKAFDRKYIPIPTAPTSDDDDVEVSDQDLAILEGASFLRHLDQKDITTYGNQCSIIQIHFDHYTTGVRRSLTECVKCRNQFGEKRSATTSPHWPQAMKKVLSQKEVHNPLQVPRTGLKVFITPRARRLHHHLTLVLMPVCLMNSYLASTAVHRMKTMIIVRRRSWACLSSCQMALFKKVPRCSSCLILSPLQTEMRRRI